MPHLGRSKNLFFDKDIQKRPTEKDINVYANNFQERSELNYLGAVNLAVESSTERDRVLCCCERAVQKMWRICLSN